MRRRIMMGKKSDNLPSEYTRLNYIEGTGTQYIDTGFIANQDTSIQMDVQFTNTTDTETLYCCRSGGLTETFSSFKLGHIWRVDYKSATRFVGVSFNATKYRVYITRNSVYLDGELKHTFEPATISPAYTMTLMASTTNGSKPSNYAKYKLFGCNIWDNDIITRDFIPCYRKSDNVAGLYDLCGSICPLTGTSFYINAGTGEFLGG